jgi:hypothetical protein
VAALGAILMRRGHLAVDATLLRVVPRMLVAGVVMMAVLWGLDAIAYAPLRGMAGWRWLGLGVLVTGGLVAYGAVGQVAGAFDLRTMLRRGGRKLS